MNFDLEPILSDWPFDPGQIKVRRFAGLDGEEKLQLRLDLGVIQMNVTGRPDGELPHGFESLFEWQKACALEAEEAGKNFRLDGEMCGELQQEAAQYHHRFVSLFQINDFRGVIADTQRNLDLLGFMSSHAEAPAIAAAVEQVRPYVLMMNTRAKASIALEREDFDSALRQIERGCQKIHDAYEAAHAPEMATKNPESDFLENWAEEIRSEKPLTNLEQMQQEMDKAIAKEAYERAAELRDAIRAHCHEEHVGPAESKHH